MRSAFRVNFPIPRITSDNLPTHADRSPCLSSPRPACMLLTSCGTGAEFVHKENARKCNARLECCAECYDVRTRTVDPTGRERVPCTVVTTSADVRRCRT